MLSRPWILFLLAGVLASCKTTTQATKKPIEPSAATVAKELRIPLATAIGFGSLSAKCDITILDSTGGSQSLNTRFRIREDSVVWASASPLLGIEALRVKMTRDSLLLLNRLGKEYLSERIDSLSAWFGINLDYSDVQCLLLGILPKQMRAMGDSADMIFLQQNPEFSSGQIRRGTLQIRADTLYLTECFIDDKARNQHLKAEYSAHERIGSFVFPQSVTFEATNNGKKRRLRLEWSKIEIGQKLEYPFKIPEQYVPFK